MTSLWNPRKALNQPPNYGQVTTVKGTPTSEPLVEREARYALKESAIGRRNRASATAFDRGTKVRK